MDPISILTATSFAIQVVDVLFKASIGTYITVQKSNGCSSTLNSYRRTLQRCNRSLVHWHEVWKGFDDVAYERFWSKDVYQEVREVLAQIDNASASIEEQLTGHKGAERQPRRQRKLSARGIIRTLSGQRAPEGEPNEQRGKPEIVGQPTDGAAWKRTIQEAKRDGGPIKVRDTGLCYRIAFALFQNELLGDEVRELEGLVSELDNTTSASFHRMRGYESATHRPTRKDVSDMRDAFLRADNFKLFTNELFEAYRKLDHECSWAIELRIPGKQDPTLQTKKKYHLDLDFLLCVDGDARRGLWRRVRVKHDSPVDVTAVARSLPDKMISPKMSSWFPDGRSEPAELGRMQRRSLPFRPLLQG